MPSISFSCLTFLTRTSSTMFNRGGDSGSILVPDIKVKIRRIYQICYLWVFHSCSFLAKASSIPNLLHAFFMKECCILSDAISASVGVCVCVCLLFINVINDIDFWHVESILHSWDKSHLVMVCNTYYILPDLVC